MNDNYVRRIEKRALGIINGYSEEEIVEKGLADDEKLLTDVFKIFNQEFYGGKLLEPIIHISPSVKEKVGIKITDFEEWIKHDSGKSELCRGLYFSDEILHYGVLSEVGMKNSYVMLAVGMITLYDREMREAYQGEIDIRDENEKALEDKKEKKKSRRKKKYKGMVTRNGYYYTEEFAVECGRIGIIATAIKDDEGKPTGRYELEAGELFLHVLNKHDLMTRRFICAKIPEYIKMKKGNESKTKSKEEKRGSSVRTYRCPICKLNMRGTSSGIRIKCCSEAHPGVEELMEEIPERKKEEKDALLVIK